MAMIDPAATNPILAEALRLLSLGYSVVPCPKGWDKRKTDSPKFQFAWKTYETNRLTPENARSIFRDAGGLAIVCGAVSGNLLMIDFDAPGAYDAFESLACDLGLGAVISQGVLESTPKGYGRHLYFKIEDGIVPGNEKLAHRIVEAMPKDKREASIETRGTGGLVFAAPSPGYEIIRGDMDDVPLISFQTMTKLLAVARSLDECLAETAPIPETIQKGASGERPGDVYNDRATWDELLGAHGWQRITSGRQRDQWTRPGKGSKVCSATTGNGLSGQDLLYVFSSNASPFDAEKTYSKFAARALLEFGGDYGAATKAIASEYGLAPPLRVVPGAYETDGYRADPETGEKIEIPTIRVNDRNLRDVTSDALDAMTAYNSPETIFVRAGGLVNIRRDERGVARIINLNLGSMAGILARAADWVKIEKKPVRVGPPKDTVVDVMSLGEWPSVPGIVSVAKAPVMAPSGAIRTDPGYDAETMVYIDSSETWPKWEGGWKAARDFLLNDLLGDFPFATDADRAHAFALMILPFVRPAISGPTPLHLVDAPTQGTGKSLLVRVALSPSAGGHIAATPVSSQEEELRKKVMSELLEGKPYLFLDNLSKKVDSDTLAGAITSTHWSDRFLGQMSSVTAAVRCTWVATGNNVSLSRDIVRRTVWIRLDSGTERPEERTGFRHEDIEGWARENRLKIVSAILCILSYWVIQGKKVCTSAKIGSFEEWARLIGGILETVEISGFLANMQELRDSANPEDEAWRAFFELWWENYESNPTRVADLFDLFKSVETLAGMIQSPTEEAARKKLGMLLRRKLGAVYGPHRIIAIKPYKGTNYLTLEKQSPTSSNEPNGRLDFGGTLVGLNYLVPPVQSEPNENGLVGLVVLDDDYAHTRVTHAHDAHARARESGVQESPTSPTSPTNEPGERGGPRFGVPPESHQLDDDEEEVF